MKAVATDVGPTIVWCTACGDRERGFLFVEENLDKDIVVLWTATVEDELYVGTHGEDAGTPPAALFELVEAVGGEVVAVDAHKTY